MSQDSHNLDILRSIAVSFVLFDHTIKFFGFERNAAFDINWLGRLGVAFFFVHTSFVLMLSLERSRLKGWRLPVNFYVRRFFRLFPLSCFVVLFTWLAGIPQASIHPHIFYGTPITPKVLLSNLTLTENFFGGGVNILGQLWSLPIEMDMYVLLPLLFIAARRWPRLFLWTSWPLAVVASFCCSHVPGFWRFNFLLFAPCFVPGVVAYILAGRLKPKVSSWVWPVYLLTLAALFLFSSHRSFWLAGMVAICIGAATSLFKEQTNKFVNIVAHTIAKYSYGIYLGHTFCIWAAFYGMHKFPWYIQGLTFVTLLCVVPYFMFVIIEQPGINIGKRVAQRLMKPRFPQRQQLDANLGLGTGAGVHQ